MRSEYLISLFIGSYETEESVAVLKRYIRYKEAHPRYFQRPSDLVAVAATGVHAVLPHRDFGGRRVFLFRLGAWNPSSKILFSDLFYLTYALAEMIALEPKTQVAGVTVIADAQNFGLKQFRHFSMEDAKTVAGFMQECFPLWLRSLHVVNPPRVFQLLFNMVKPLLGQRVRDALMLHGGCGDLHPHVPKEILPEDWGGDQPKFNNTECFEALRKMDAVFTEIEGFRLD